MTATPPSQATDPVLLSEVLHRAGVLPDGRVREVIIKSSRDTLISRIFWLQLEIDDASADTPATLILKTGLPRRLATAWQPGRQEVSFYNTIAPVMEKGLLPRCFDARWDEATRDWYILLEDLTDTHSVPTTWPLPPTMEQCVAIVDARARAHAAWWDDPRLGVSVGTKFDEALTKRYVDELTPLVASFADLLGDRLPPERLRLYEQFLAAAPTVLGRLRSHQNVTIIHGDAHVWNAFMPRDGGKDIRLFDWDGWRVAPATHDLAYMMATHWYPDRRHRLERPLLDRYHTALLSHGITGYSRDMLDDDYRFSVLLQIAVPVRQAALDLPPVIWWSHLDRIMAAIDDLGCRDLLT